MVKQILFEVEVVDNGFVLRTKTNGIKISGETRLVYTNLSDVKFYAEAFLQTRFSNLAIELGDKECL